MTSCHIAAVECPAASDIAYAQKFGEGRSFDDVITYVCDPGLQLTTQDTYRLTDGETAKTVRCQQNETWTETVLSCERKTWTNIIHITFSLPVHVLHVRTS